MSQYSSHASTSIRSPILNGQPSNHTLNAPTSPRHSTRGSTPTSVHLPAQPTVPPITTKSPSPLPSNAPRQPTYQASTRAQAQATTPTAAATGRTSDPPPVHISPSQAQIDRDATTRKYGSGGSNTSSTTSPSTATTTSSASLLPDDWQQDSSVTACHQCKTKFSLLTRKHHCRSCGLIHCDACSKYRSTVPSKGYHERVRVCSKCYHHMKKGKKSAGGSPSEKNAILPGDTTGLETSPQSPRESPNQQDHPGRSSSSSHQHSQHHRGSSTSSTANIADELQQQLSALHSLHSSYQPEHHYLTSLLSNASQLEQTYISTIQVLYSYLQHQQSAHSQEWRAQQQLISQQQRQIEHLEEIVRTGGALGTNARNSRGASPVPTSMQQPSGVPGNRSASPSLASMNSNPSSRASPSLHGFTLSAGGGLKGLHSLSSSSAGGAGNLTPTSAAHTYPLPPLPFAFPSATNHPPVMYDAASEEAYLEPDDAAVPVTQSGFLSPPLLSDAAHIPTSHSSRHASYKPPVPTPTSNANSNSVLTVTEPPSPPHKANNHPPVPGEKQKRMRRASSNPTASTPPEKSRKRASAAENNPDPSVHKLMDAIGM